MLKIKNSCKINIAEKDSFRIVVVTSGKGKLTDNFGNEIALKQGNVLLIPATTEWIDICSSNGNAIEVITTYVP